MIVIQVISTIWSKASRGAPRATIRNNIPEVMELALPDEDLRPTHILLHHVQFTEKTNFKNPEVILKWLSEDAFAHRCIKVSTSNGHTQLIYNWDSYAVGGAPARTYFDENGNRKSLIKQLNIHEGEWKQIKYNGRFTPLNNHSWYEKHVANVSNISSLDTTVFTKTEPSEVFSEIQHLL